MERLSWVVVELVLTRQLASEPAQQPLLYANKELLYFYDEPIIKIPENYVLKYNLVLFVLYYRKPLIE